MKFNRVDLVPRHIDLLRVRYSVSPEQDPGGVLERLIAGEPFVALDRYSGSGQQHLLLCAVDYDELVEENIAVQIQLFANDALGLGALRGTERPGDVLPLMLSLPAVTQADCAAEMSFELPEDAEPIPPFFPLPRRLDEAAADAITGIHAVKHRPGSTEHDFSFILDRTDPPFTTLSLEFAWAMPLAADTLANVAARASEIAMGLGLPAPAAPTPNQPSGRRHTR